MSYHVQYPGGYDRVLAWLAANSPATVSDICAVLGVTRSRALLVLRAAKRNGDVQDVPFSSCQLYPVQWSVTRPS